MLTLPAKLPIAFSFPLNAVHNALMSYFVILVIFFGSWILWRYYRFTVAPRIWPSEPRTAHYLVPCEYCLSSRIRIR